MHSLNDKLANLIVGSVFIAIGLVFTIIPFVPGFPLVLAGLYLFKKALWGKFGKSSPAASQQSNKTGNVRRPPASDLP